jgi:hypothetical protein
VRVFNWREAALFLGMLFATFAYAGALAALTIAYGEWALVAGIGLMVVAGTLAAGFGL